MKHSPRSKRSRKRDRQALREELLRPSSYLGYDHDRLGVYFLERGADDLAESELRRAVWLNPYEVAFQAHWAIALTRLSRLDEARKLLENVLAAEPDNATALRLWRRYWPAEPTSREAQPASPVESHP